MASSTTIGDSQEQAVQPAVGILEWPIVAQADVEDIDNAINDSTKSGKKLGAAFIMTLTEGGTDIIIAQGTAVDDAWHQVSDAGASPITPA